MRRSSNVRFETTRAPAQVPISGSVVGDDGKKNIGNLRRDTPWETSQSNVTDRDSDIP